MLWQGLQLIKKNANYQQAAKICSFQNCMPCPQQQLITVYQHTRKDGHAGTQCPSIPAACKLRKPIRSSEGQFEPLLNLAPDLRTLLNKSQENV